MSQNGKARLGGKIVRSGHRTVLPHRIEPRGGCPNIFWISESEGHLQESGVRIGSIGDGKLFRLVDHRIELFCRRYWDDLCMVISVGYHYHPHYHSAWLRS